MSQKKEIKIYISIDEYNKDSIKRGKVNSLTNASTFREAYEWLEEQEALIREK